MKSLCRSHLTLLSFLLVLASAVSEARAIGIWHRDYATARDEAKAEGKNLLIVFTGTDWIDICAKFYDEILGQPEFIDTVSTEFALLKLEFPKDNQMPREEAMQKALLRDAYRVRGYPTVVMTDAEGRPFGINGFQPISAKEYAMQLLEIAETNQENLAAIKEAESLTGVEKAKRLSRGIPDLPGLLVARFYSKEMEAVLAEDPEDHLKLREPFGKLIAEAEYVHDIQSLVRESKWSEVIALTDRHIVSQKFAGAELQSALINRAGFERRAGQGDKATTTLREALAIDPQSAPGREAERLLKNPESLEKSLPEAAPRAEPLE